MVCAKENLWYEWKNIPGIIYRRKSWINNSDIGIYRHNVCLNYYLSGGHKIQPCFRLNPCSVILKAIPFPDIYFTCWTCSCDIKRNAGQDTNNDIKSFEALKLGITTNLSVMLKIKTVNLSWLLAVWYTQYFDMY